MGILNPLPQNRIAVGICMCSGPRAKSMTRPAQLCTHMSIINDRDGHACTYVHTYVRTYVDHENRSLIQSLTLMHSAINKVQVYIVC